MMEIRPKIAEVPKRWNEYKNSRLNELHEQFQKDMSALLHNPMLERTLYDEFSKRGQTTEAFGILDRACYWESGEYSLDIIVNTSKPTRQFTESFRFNLSEEDVEQLRVNAVSIIEYLCGLKVYWFYAYPKYLEKI